MLTPRPWSSQRRGVDLGTNAGRDEICITRTGALRSMQAGES